MIHFIPRPDDQRAIYSLMKIFPVTILTGPRQCGKTTLARTVKADHYFDLENPADLAIFDNPQLNLERLKGTTVIDEVQRKPELFPILRYIVDSFGNRRYLLLGSASPDLVRKGSESLAGRAGFHELGPFKLEEVGTDNLRTLWLRGGFPLSFLSETEDSSVIWRENYIRTFLERDIPQLGITIPSESLRRFWIMISHYHGQLLNASELGRAFGISDKTIKSYLDILVGTYMIRLLQPWYKNVGKRLVKSPKLYIRDSGIFHTLQSVDTENNLLSHPKVGASWEGFALEQAIAALGIKEPFFWRTHNGAELDLLWFDKGKSWGIEVKYADAPSMTKAIHAVIEDLHLQHIWILYPGEKMYSLHEKVTVLPLAKLHKVPNHH